jgi:hypothetical protein
MLLVMWVMTACVVTLSVAAYDVTLMLLWVHVFQACPVWIYTQNTQNTQIITSTIFAWVHYTNTEKNSCRVSLFTHWLLSRTTLHYFLILFLMPDDRVYTILDEQNFVQESLSKSSIFHFNCCYCCGKRFYSIARVDEFTRQNLKLYNFTKANLLDWHIPV